MSSGIKEENILVLHIKGGIVGGYWKLQKDKN